MMQRIASLAWASRSARVIARIHRLGQRVLLLRAVHPDDADGAVVGHDDWGRS